jgi:hypothetical protein
MAGQSSAALRSQVPTARRLPASVAVRLLALWHLCSLDAPSVAIVWSLGFAWAMGVRLAPWVPAMQVLAVWAVYVCDRLLDARPAMEAGQLQRLRERHLFHWRHRRVLLPLAVGAACAACGLILAFMPIAARERNSVLAAACLAYFARVHGDRKRNGSARPFLPAFITKELLVGVLFTAGCALPVFGSLWALRRASFGPLLCVTAFFALLAWLNCRAIDQWECEGRECGRWECGARGRQSRSSFSAACMLAIAGLALAAVITPLPLVAALLAAGGASAAMLALLDRKRDRLRPITLRAAADMVLLTPAVLLAFARILR